MNINTTNTYEGGLSLPARFKRKVAIIASLIIFISLQLIGSQTSITILSKIARYKKWIFSILVAGNLVLVAMWVRLLSRPFSAEFLGLQILSITAVSSVVVVGYKAIPTNTLPETLYRAKWTMVIAIVKLYQATHTGIRALVHPSNKTRVFKSIIVLSLLCVAIWNRQPVLQAAALIQDQDTVIAYLNQFGPLAPLFLGIALVLQVFIAAIPGHVLILGGGYVYGFWTILAISIISTVGASQLAFLLAKWAGHPVVERLAPRQVLEKWNDTAETNSMIFFMFAFMLPVFPADVLNYVAGLSPISGRRFFVANFIGRLPGLILLSVLGATGLDITPLLILTITAVGLIMFISWYYIFVYQKKNKTLVNQDVA